MNNLTVISQQGTLLVDSREVAQMVDKNHNDLLRDIKGYSQILEKADLRSQDFFIESTYKADGNNRNYLCYLITKKGCDMIANKLSGAKGVLFTAAYVTEFERMSEQQKAMSQVEVDLIAAKYAVEILRPSEAGKIKMLTTVCNNHNVNTNFLPAYTEEAISKSATELLDAAGKPMSVIAFNKRLVDLGFLEIKTRYGRGKTTKTFKSLTKTGEEYGKNLISTVNERETQPHYYVDKFDELLRKVTE